MADCCCLKAKSGAPWRSYNGGDHHRQSIKKIACVENLVYWSYSSDFTTTTATHHAGMMHQLSGRKEVTNSVWRLPIQWLGSWPPWLVGACLLATLPSKNRLTTTQLATMIGPHRWCTMLESSYAEYSYAEYINAEWAHQK